MPAASVPYPPTSLQRRLGLISTGQLNAGRSLLF